MAWPCSMFAVFAVVFSGCFQTVHSSGERPNVRTSLKSRCQTPACYALEAAMKEKMNLSADPCEDFDEFACGRFHKEHVLPNGTSSSSHFSVLHIKNTVLMQEILTNESDYIHPQYLVNMRRFYNSCVNETQIERVGLTPYFNEQTFADDWPTLNPRWSEADFDLNEVIARYAGVSVFPIFYVETWKDPKTKNRYMIHADSPFPTLSSYQLTRPRNNSIILAYEKYLAEIAIALNANRDVAERDARDVVDLEIEIARYLYFQRRQRFHPSYQVKLNQLSMLYPRFDIERAIRSTYSAANITLPDDEVVNIDFPAYMKDIESVLECFPKRTIQNLFGFYYALQLVPRTTRRTWEIYKDFKRVELGAETQETRWEYCLSLTGSIFQLGMEAIEIHIYYKRREIQHSDLDRIYENYTMSEDNFYSNHRLGIRLEERRKLAYLRKPIYARWIDFDFSGKKWLKRAKEIMFLGFKTTTTQPQYLTKMRRLYKSCVNETQIELVGVTPYLNDRAFVDDWPTLNPRWSDASFDVNEVIARYAGLKIFPIIIVGSAIKLKNASRYEVVISQPHLGLTQSGFLAPRNNSIIMAYQKYLAETAIALNANRDVAERDARDVVDLEIELARILVPGEKYADLSTVINPVKLNQFSVLYPRLDIERAIRSTFSTVNITLPDDEVVTNYFPAYIKDIEAVLECFPKRTIQNLFGFKYAVSKVAGLTKRLREISLDYNKARSGVQTETPRLQFCLETTAYIFQQGMSKQFVDRVFTETAKQSILEMITELKFELKKRIFSATWMTDETKAEALKKLEAMKSKIGYPDGEFQDADIDRLYENYDMREDSYYDNKVLGLRLRHLRLLALLRKPIDVNIWHTAPYTVNPFLDHQANAIAFPAGMLQPPFYSELLPSYVNYAAIGSAIGHQITHLFDLRGMQFDKNGNLRNWWTTEDVDNFKNRSKCIINQYNKFYIAEINMTLNGENTQGENEGDTSGLKIAFRAYKQHLLRSGNPERLPTLDLSPDQLFFLAFAQHWCQKFTKNALISQVQSGWRSPGKYRIIGALQNLDDFARLYNCPRGSYMNPERKCGVW